MAHRQCLIEPLLSLQQIRLELFAMGGFVLLRDSKDGLGMCCAFGSVEIDGSVIVAHVAHASMADREGAAPAHMFGSADFASRPGNETCL